MNAWLRAVLTVIVGGLLSFGLAGCEEKATTTRDVEVKDELGGGKEIKETEVTEQNGRVQVKETETDVDEEGNVEEKEVKIEGGGTQ